MFENADILTTLEEQIDRRYSALIIVDVQNDFVHPDGHIAKSSIKHWDDMTLIPAMLENTGRFLEVARRFDVLTVFVQMIGDQKYQSPPWIARQRRTGSKGGSCLEGTWGADFYGDIRPNGRDREIVVPKHRYSAFWGTRLEQILHSHDIKTLLMAGDATNGCVESTTRDAFCADFYVVTLADCCGDFDQTRHEMSLRKMDQAYGFVTDSTEVEGLWEHSILVTGR